MDSFVVPLSPSIQNPKPLLRPRWRRLLVELNGKSDPRYRRDLTSLLMKSYYQTGVFAHSYRIDGEPCATHVSWFVSGGEEISDLHNFGKHGVSCLELDSKGVYLASATKLGCLTVHDFDTLYCQTTKFLPDPKEDETKHLLHINTGHQIDVVRWNIANQDEVACTSMRSSEVYIFDIGYVSSKPVEVLRIRSAVSIHGSGVHKGLSDVTFTLHDDSRLLASDTHGVVNVWDRRSSELPCLELTTNSSSSLNSIQLDVAEQMIFGASKNGMIYMWDLRGGRSSAAFQNHKEVCYSPMISIKLASMLDKIKSLKAQTSIVAKEIHSIDINPYCPYQLAFHLDDGWSGVIDITNFQVTHIHCPPPAWLDGSSDSVSPVYFRKPAWMSSYPIYVVGSSSSKGINILDFYPDSNSPCHVDYDDHKDNVQEENIQHRQNRFVPTSESVTACSIHPLNGTIVAGTKQSSIMMISERRQSCKEEDNCVTEHI
ncbi:uncharacterized protein LOC141659434 isoform X1 [Apium graveolens]|uniref:uncharacterized protein LOC141659434 isoform X1 n=1 Tax=Apium graveolens TaxID=4045 RepID=UPI003D7B77DA